MKKNYFLRAMLLGLSLVSLHQLHSQCFNCGTGANGAYLASGNTSLVGGTYNYTSFTINSGVTVNVTGSQPLVIYCSGAITINGTLDASGGNGGNGVTFSTYGIAGVGVAGGQNGGDGSFSPSVGPLNGVSGSGAGGGGMGIGWSGGGGAGYAANGTSSGGVGGIGGIIYGNPQISPTVGGSGGAGGSGGYNCGSGGGGGGGGYIFISSCGTMTIGAGGVIRANGGNGGSDGTGNCGGGGGGSGGSIFLATSTFINNGTISAVGGTGGVSTLVGPPYYGVGGVGAVGRVRLDVSTSSGSGTITPASGYNGTVMLITMTSSNVTCGGSCDGSASVSVSGGTPAYTYLWSPGGGTAASATGLCAGTYTCTVTDANGCSNTSTVTITQPTPIALAILQLNNVSCFGACNGMATVAATGGTGPYTFIWSNGSTSSTLVNACAGVYTCTVTDVMGCTMTTSLTITEPTQIVPFFNTTPVTCFGACDATYTDVTYGGTLPYSENWSPAPPACAGTFTCTVTDANGCVATTSVTITQPSQIVASITAVDATCGMCNGSASATASGGTGAFTYMWVPGNITSSTATGLCAGCYTLTVTDANGCSNTQTVCIANTTGVAVALAQVNNPTCFGDCNGAITAVATGGNGPYTYLWSNNATTSSIVGLCAGTYSVTVTDANGCTSTVTVALTEPAQLVASGTSTSSSGSNGTVSGTATGGTPAYSYSWAPGGLNGANQSSLAPGTYTLTVTDANGCTDTTVVTVLLDGISSFTMNPVSVDIYPNPANEQLQLNVVAAHKAATRLEVSNVLGEITAIIEFGNVSEVNYAYNTSVLPNGVYFFQVISGSTVVTKKITVSH